MSTDGVNTEARVPIPLEELYNLKNNQKFIMADGVVPTLETDRDRHDYSKYEFPQDPIRLAQFGVKTLLNTGLYSNVEIVKELNTITGEPTGEAGFILTMKPKESNKV